MQFYPKYLITMTAHIVRCFFNFSVILSSTPVIEFFHTPHHMTRVVLVKKRNSVPCLWLHVFWTPCGCQILTFWTVYHRTFTLRPVHLDISHTIFSGLLLRYGGLPIWNVRSKVKTIYLPKSVKVNFSFCPWQGGLGVGWVGSCWWENVYPFKDRGTQHVEHIGMFLSICGTI